MKILKNEGGLGVVFVGNLLLWVVEHLSRRISHSHWQRPQALPPWWVRWRLRGWCCTPCRVPSGGRNALELASGLASTPRDRTHAALRESQEGSFPKRYIVSSLALLATHVNFTLRPSVVFFCGFRCVITSPVANERVRWLVRASVLLGVAVTRAHDLKVEVWDAVPSKSTTVELVSCRRAKILKSRCKKCVSTRVDMQPVARVGTGVVATTPGLVFPVVDMYFGLRDMLQYLRFIQILPVAGGTGSAVLEAIHPL